MNDTAPTTRALTRIDSLLHAVRLLLLVAAGFLLGLGTGCANSSFKINLPEISAESIRYQRTDPAGGTKITATNVVNHDDKVTADKVVLTTIYPTFSVSIEVDGYSRKKDTGAAAAAK